MRAFASLSVQLKLCVCIRSCWCEPSIFKYIVYLCSCFPSLRWFCQSYVDSENVLLTYLLCYYMSASTLYTQNKQCACLMHVCQQYCIISCIILFCPLCRIYYETYAWGLIGICHIRLCNILLWKWITEKHTYTTPSGTGKYISKKCIHFIMANNLYSNFHNNIPYVCAGR